MNYRGGVQRSYSGNGQNVIYPGLTHDIDQLIIFKEVNIPLPPLEIKYIIAAENMETIEREDFIDLNLTN